MAGKKDWMSKMATLDGALTKYRNIHSTVIQTVSPSLNFIFGNGWGLPLGHSMVLYGPPKSGKSIISYLMAGGAHAAYPDGIVIKFNTEFREEGQMPPELMPRYGVDMSRYMAIQANHPAKIYDQLANKIGPWCEDGMPLKLVIIDSMNGIQGRRAITNEGGIMTQQIGDVALTNKEGLKQVLEIQHKYNFALLMTSHVAVEMDPIEQKRGNKFRMGASIGVQHHAEYFAFVEANRNKAGRTNLLEEELVNEEMQDLNDNPDRTGHKVRVIMKDSSMGPKGRFGEFTYDYNNGVINTHEEIFLLGKNRGLIKVSGGAYYEIPGYAMPDIQGAKNMVKFLKEDKKAQEYVYAKLREQDLSGASKTADEKDAATWAANTVLTAEEMA